MRHKRLRLTALLLTGASFISPTALPAQFVTPLPPPLPATQVVLDDLRDSLFDVARAHLRDKPALSPDEKHKYLSDITTSACKAIDSKVATSDCVDFVKLDVLATNIDAETPVVKRRFLELNLPISHRRRFLASYLKGVGAEGLSIFSRFAANITDKTAFIATDVISGLADRTIFGVTYAAVVTKSTALDSTQRRVIEDNTATVLRLINNGGTLSGRFQWPLHAGGGTMSQGASSLYLQAGLVGPLGNTDSLRFSAASVAEYVGSITVRRPDDSGEIEGEVLWGVRGGAAYAEGDIVSTFHEHWLPFAQLAIGLRQQGKVGISVLLTVTENKFKAFVPSLVVNFSAIR